MDLVITITSKERKHVKQAKPESLRKFQTFRLFEFQIWNARAAVSLHIIIAILAQGSQAEFQPKAGFCLSMSVRSSDSRCKAVASGTRFVAGVCAVVVVLVAAVVVLVALWAVAIFFIWGVPPVPHEVVPCDHRHQHDLADNSARCAELIAKYDPQSENCPSEQWKADRQDPTNCFVRLALKGNYGCCVEACRAMNASIACISSERQNDFMYMVGNCGEGKERGAQGFIGLYQTHLGLTWEWVSGCRSKFLNWNEGEPSDWQHSTGVGGEDCATFHYMGTVGGWNDETCSGRGDGPGTDGCFCQYDGSGSNISNSFVRQQKLDYTLKCSKKFSEDELSQMLAGDVLHFYTSDTNESDELPVCSSDPPAAFLICIIMQLSFIA